MAEQPVWQLDAAGHVLLRFARLLLGAGADSEYAQQRAEALATRLGLTVQLFIGSERLILTIGSGGIYRTRTGHALGALGIDAGRLSALECVAGAIATGNLDAAAADARLEAIERQGSSYPAWLVILAMASTTAALARLFGAQWPVVGAALLAGLVSMILRRALARRDMLPAAIAAVTAFVSGMTAVLPLHFLDTDPSLTLVAAGMVLVPGVPLINGVRDLVEGHAAIGLARLANALVAILAIASGLAVLTSACRLHFPVAMQTGSLILSWDFVFAGIAAFGFAILFNAPRRAILAILLCGALTHALRSLVLALSGDIGLATLVAACLAALVASALAQHFGTPWTGFAFPAVVALVPGSYAFRGMIGLLDIMAGPASSIELLSATLAALTGAAVLTAAIGIGLLLGAALSRAIGRATGWTPADCH